MDFKNNIPVVIFLIGAPGSGKSTFVEHLIERYPEKKFEIISTDNMIEIEAKRLGKTYSEIFSNFIKDATKQFNINFINGLKNKKNLVIDRTNMTKNSRKNLLLSIPKEYHRIAFVFNISRVELDNRLEKRKIKSGKDIHKNVIDNMIANYETPSLDEFDKIIFV